MNPPCKLCQRRMVLDQFYKVDLENKKWSFVFACYGCSVKAYTFYEEKRKEGRIEEWKQLNNSHKINPFEL